MRPVVLKWLRATSNMMCDVFSAHSQQQW